MLSFEEIQSVPLEAWRAKAVRDDFKARFPTVPMSHYGEKVSELYGELYPNEYFQTYGAMQREPMSITIVEYADKYQVFLNMPTWEFNSWSEVIYFFNYISTEFILGHRHDYVRLNPPNKKHKRDMSVSDV
jgi:hypothetical protein